MKTVGLFAKILLLALLFALVFRLLFPAAHAQDSADDGYANQWFKYAEDASSIIEMRYVVLKDGARVYIRYTQRDPGTVGGPPLTLIVAQFHALCGADGVAPASVNLQRFTNYDPVTEQPIQDSGYDPTGIPATVDTRKPLGRIIAIACAAHAYAIQHGIR